MDWILPHKNVFFASQSFSSCLESCPEHPNPRRKGGALWLRLSSAEGKASCFPCSWLALWHPTPICCRTLEACKVGIWYWCKKDKELESCMQLWDVGRQKDLKLLFSFLAVLDSCGVWQVFHRRTVLQWNLTKISTSWLSPLVLFKFIISFLKALYYLHLILVGRYFMCLACLLNLRFRRSMNYWNYFFWDAFSLSFRLIFLCNMEIITKSKFMAVLDLEKMCCGVIKITLLWPFPILQAGVQKNKGITFFISEGSWTTVIFCIDRNMEITF